MRVRHTSKLNDDLHKSRTKAIESVFPKCGTVLDIGPGRNETFYRAGGCDLVTFDIDHRAKPAVVGNAEMLPFRDGAFDFIIATEVIEHVRHPKRLLDEICRAAKDGAGLVISTPNVAHLTNRVGFFLLGDFHDDRTLHDESDVGHIHFFTRDFFIRTLRAQGLEIVREWSSFIPITPRKYIDADGLSNLFRGLAKQSIAYCRVRKKLPK